MKRICAMTLVILLALCANAYAITGTEFKVVKCNSYITLRDDASTKAGEVDRVPLSDTVVALSYADNGFYYVNYDGKDGYVLSKYLEPIEAAEGTDVTLSRNERYNINLFLSNFTEQSFTYLSKGVFDIYSMDERALVEFGVNFAWFNKYDSIEWGQWGENNVRVHEDEVLEAIRKYFGIVPLQPDPIYVDYSAPYFYWGETGGHVKDGFACLRSCEYLGANRYRIEYMTFGAGYGWENSDCYMTGDEAVKVYPDSGSEGVAVIYAGDLTDRTTFRLERMVEGR